MSRLLEAVFANDLVKIADLLDREPSRIKDPDALCQAIGWGRREAVKLLIQRGVDQNAIDRNGNHPLHMACLSLAEDLYDELVRAGGDPHLAPGLATRAAWGGRADILAHLREKGLDLNEPDTRGIRPLEAAVGMGCLRAVEFLLSQNVDTTRLDVSKPLKLCKGALPNQGAMEEIRQRISAKQTRQLAAQNEKPSSAE